METALGGGRGGELEEGERGPGGRSEEGAQPPLLVCVLVCKMWTPSIFLNPSDVKG